MSKFPPRMTVVHYVERGLDGYAPGSYEYLSEIEHEAAMAEREALLVEALEDASEALHVQFDVIENLKINSCLPTEDEVCQAMQAKNSAREALKSLEKK